MKIVRVNYTIKQEFVETNKRNINRVMQDLKAMNNPGIKYASFIEPDGKTFMHFAMYPDDATAQIVNDLPSFSTFRSELKSSMPDVPPRAVDLSLVASAYDLF